MKVNFKLMTMAFFAMAALITSCSKDSIGSTSEVNGNIAPSADRLGPINFIHTGNGGAFAYWSPFGNGTYKVTVQDVTEKPGLIIIDEIIIFNSLTVNGLKSGHTYRYTVTDEQGLNFIITDDVMM